MPNVGNCSYELEDITSQNREIAHICRHTYSHFAKPITCLFMGSCNCPDWILFWSNTSNNIQLAHLPPTMNAHYSEICLFSTQYVWPYSKLSSTVSHNQPSCNSQISQEGYCFIKDLSDWGQNKEKSDRSLLSRISGTADDNELLNLPLRRYFPES